MNKYQPLKKRIIQEQLALDNTEVPPQMPHIKFIPVKPQQPTPQEVPVVQNTPEIKPQIMSKPAPMKRDTGSQVSGDDLLSPTQISLLEKIELLQIQVKMVEDRKEQSTSKPQTSPDPTPNGRYVSIGPNNTEILVSEYEKIPWKSPTVATRKLLACVFSRETLASSSMTGKPSPAFKHLNRAVKKRLDEKAVNDIISVVHEKSGASLKEIKTAITTKCADENKMLKQRERKKQGVKKIDPEP